MNVHELKSIEKEFGAHDKESLVDITKIHIDQSLPQQEKIEAFIKEIKNPYCFLCNGVTVRVSFTDTEFTLEDRLKYLLG